MFSRCASVAVIGFVAVSAGYRVDAGEGAGMAHYVNEAEYDFVTDTDKSKETLQVISNEDDNVQMMWNLISNHWMLMNTAPVNTWARNSLGEITTTVSYRASSMAFPAKVEMLKAGDSLFGTTEFSHGKKALASNKVGVKICGKSYTFDLTHPDVAKARKAINLVVVQK
jgi:hypothetical protein